jgi:thiol-disulfide isomerase/thioredoxin
MRTVVRTGVFILGIALGAGAGAALWYAPESTAPETRAAVVRTTPLTAAPAPVVDSSAPDFSLVDLEGRTAALSYWRGTAVVLNFWATWCEPCREELPLLDRIARTHAPSLVVIAVESGEPEEEVRAFREALNLTSIRVLPDPAGRIGDLYLVRGLPTTFFIDPAGVVRRIKIGTLDSAGLESILDQMGVTS